MPEFEQEFKKYSRKGLSEMRPFALSEDMSTISVSAEDLKLKTLIGGYVARNPVNHADQWYVSRDYFIANLQEFTEPIEVIVSDEGEKSLGNTDANGAKKNVKDIVFFGDGDTFRLISKASSKKEGWMKSTKAMQIHGVGCVIQVTTQQGDNVSEALTFVPGVKIYQSTFEGTDEIYRQITAI